MFPEIYSALQKKPLVSDLGRDHGTCDTHVPRYMSGSLPAVAEENVPGIPGACVTSNFTYLERGPCHEIPFVVSRLGHADVFQDI